MSVLQRFSFGSPDIIFHPGARWSVGDRVRELGVGKALVVTDPQVEATGVVEDVERSLRQAGVDSVRYAQAHVEPTERSVEAAVAALHGSAWDAVVAVGGGSAIDTAKAMNVLQGPHANVREHVQEPLGEGRPPARTPRPLVAVPTTAGSGSEVTENCALKLTDSIGKGVIRHPSVRPSVAIVDPEAIWGLPRGPAMSAVMDSVIRAVESLTHRAPDDGPGHAHPGRNVLGDALSERALTLIGSAFALYVADSDDPTARHDMALASMLSALASVAAGAHLPHACAYGVAGLSRGYRPAGYPGNELLPHGQSVAITAPAAFRATYDGAPERHVRAARLLAPQRTFRGNDREALPEVLDSLMELAGMPRRLRAVGIGEAHADEFVGAVSDQRRLLANAPAAVDGRTLVEIFRSSL